jgi:glycosyltransferase involved in cell wall biosynthesis
VAILKDIAMFRTTFPNKVFDYMAAARPTILAIDGVIRHVIEKSGGDLRQPADGEALAHAVLTIHRDKSMGRTMGRSARDYVARHFDRAVQSQDFVALVENNCVIRAL